MVGKLEAKQKLLIGLAIIILILVAISISILLASTVHIFSNENDIEDEEFDWAKNINFSYITKKTDFKYETGIKVTEDDQIIENYVFYDIPIGIAVWGSNVTIRFCIFINCSDEGIVFFHTSNGNVENCSFIECCDGIELQQAHNTTIMYCEFTRNYHAGIDVIGEPSYGLLVINCRYTDNVMDTYGV